MKRNRRRQAIGPGIALVLAALLLTSSATGSRRAAVSAQADFKIAYTHSSGPVWARGDVFVMNADGSGQPGGSELVLRAARQVPQPAPVRVHDVNLLLAVAAAEQGDPHRTGGRSSSRKPRLRAARQSYRCAATFDSIA